MTDQKGAVPSETTLEMEINVHRKIENKNRRGIISDVHISNSHAIFQLN